MAADRGADRRRRIGINEAMFRAVNERLESLNDAFEGPTKTFEVICECASLDCSAQFTMSRQAYEQLRADPTLFVVLPNHEDPSVEKVVDESGRYVVVRKRSGGPAEAAVAHDPRSGPS
jgi:hypothetical protein